MEFYSFSIFDILPFYVVVILFYYYMNRELSAKKKALCCFLILFVFSAIRYGIGYDYYSYKALVTHNVLEYAYERMEPLSELIIEIAYRTHYQVFFVIGAFLSLYPLYKAYLKRSISPAFSLFIYYLFPLFFLGNQSVVRNGIAFSLVFYAFILLLEEKKKEKMLSVLFVFCAFLFHKSALIGLLIYPIYFIRLQRTPHLVAYLASFGLSYVVTSFISGFYNENELVSSAQHYIEKANEGGGSMTFVVNGLGLINFLFWKQLSKLDKHMPLYLGMFNVGVCIWNIFQGVDITLATRLSVFFLLTMTLIIPYYVRRQSLSKRVDVKQVTHAFFLLLFTSYFVINVYSFLQHGGRMSNVPYQVVFWHKDYYNLQ